MPDVPLARLGAFLRQHAHDVRNALNSLQLEASVLEQLSTDPEVQESAGRMRRQALALAARLKSLGGRFHEHRVARRRLGAAEVFAGLRAATEAAGGLELTWLEEPCPVEVEVDPALVEEAFAELVANAESFPPAGTVAAALRAAPGGAEISLIEPKSTPLDPSDWGEPFVSTRKGGAGLGLWRVGTVLTAAGASLRRRYDAGAQTLVTTIELPQAPQP